MMRNRHPGFFLQLQGHDVAGIGDGHPNAGEAGGHDPRRERGHLGGREQVLGVAVRLGRRHMARRVDDDVAARELLVVARAVDDARTARIIGHGVEHVVGLCAGELRVPIAEPQLLHRSVRKKHVRHMRAHMAQTDDSDLAQAAHFRLRCV